MKKRFKNFFKRIIIVIINFLKKNWHNILGGSLIQLVTLFISLNYTISDKALVILGFIFMFIGITLSEKIKQLFLFRSFYSILEKIGEILKQYKENGKNFLTYLNFTIKQDINSTLDEVLEMFDNHVVELSIKKYENIIKNLILVVSKKKLKKVSIIGSCFILPHTFNVNCEYAKMWINIKEGILKYLDESSNCERILGNHEKKVVLDSISKDPDKFVDFCKWHINTGFKLFIFNGSLNNQLQDYGLILNDFVLFPEIDLGVGGKISIDEKNKQFVENNFPETIIENSRFINGILFKKYLKRYNEIKSDQKCKEVDLEKTILTKTLKYKNV